MDAGRVKQDIVSLSLKAGFDVAGIAGPEEAGHAKLAEFLQAGFAGDMDWLIRRSDERAAPRALWPQVNSIVVLGKNYGPDHDPLDSLKRRDRGIVSVYAQGKDYHDVLKKRLKAVARQMVDDHGCEVKVFVDTAPVMEKPLGQRGGIGWQGKHTNLVSRSFGSWLFLGEIYTTLELAPDTAEVDHCGSCHACLDICPTRAFREPYRLDARRCISYLTIEHKGHIAREFRAAMGNRIYGCDDCLATCPWNKFAAAAVEPAFLPRGALDMPRLADLAVLDDAGFRRLFAGSPVKRTGRDRFVRNVLIAIGNSGKRELASVAEARLDDVSPLVRAMAVWALSRLVSAERFAELSASHLSKEDDDDVRREWEQPELMDAAS